MLDKKFYEEKPYIEETIVSIKKIYNPRYGDERICECGHTYVNHFNSNDMSAIGCKHCVCNEFIEKE